jgi:hypothetical protein
MAKIEQIDIDKHLVIPIPQGLEKTDLALMVANYFNYQSEVKTIENKEFKGLAEDFAEQVKDLVLGEDYAIIQSNPLDNNIVEIKYQQVVKVPNELTAYQFGIAQAIKPLGDLIRTIVIAMENAKIEADKKALEEQAAQNADYINSKLDNIKAL